MTKQQKKRISTNLSAALVTSAILPTIVSAATTDYVVEKGDNLYRLAIEFNTTVNEIVATNNIANRNLIYVDQKLSIPTNTVSSTGSSSSSSSSSSTGSYYYVLQGDTLSEIAQKFGVTVSQLASWNNISDVNFIRTGTLLRVGYSSTGSSSSSSSSSSSTGSYYDGTTYQVQKNDNLTKIAAKFGTTVWELAAWNNISNIHFIREGAYLIVNGGSVATTPSVDTSDVVLASNQYRVQSGDNLYRLAINFNTTVSQLAAWNNISNVRLIHVGDILQVAPAGTSVQSGTLSAMSTATPDVAPEVVAPEVVTPEATTSTETTVEVPETLGTETSVETTETATEDAVDTLPEIVESNDVVEVEEEYVEIPEVEDVTLQSGIIQVESAYIEIPESNTATTLEVADRYEYTEPAEEVAPVEVETLAAVAPVVPAAPALAMNEYRVAENTTAYNLAALFNVSVGELLTWNEVPNPQAISAGTVLQVRA